MWFKNIRYFSLVKSLTYTPNTLANKLEALAFTQCPKTLPFSAGWIPPSEEEYSSLVHAIKGYMMVCLQIENKILPAIVVNQDLKEKVKEIESTQQRKVSAKEKDTIKNGIYSALLPKAFTKKSKIFAYFDIKNNWLIVDTVNTPKIELFLNTLKKTLPNVTVIAPQPKKPSTIMSHWLLNDSHPNSLSIEKACVLQDPNNAGRMIRCQQQDLSSRTIKALLNDGYEVSQLALSWYDRMTFTLKDDLSLQSLRFQDMVLELAKEGVKNQQEKFDADFVIMTETLSDLLIDLVKALSKGSKAK